MGSPIILPSVAGISTLARRAAVCVTVGSVCALARGLLRRHGARSLGRSGWFAFLVKRAPGQDAKGTVIFGMVSTGS